MFAALAPGGSHKVWPGDGRGVAEGWPRAGRVHPFSSIFKSFRMRSGRHPSISLFKHRWADFQVREAA